MKKIYKKKWGFDIPKKDSLGFNRISIKMAKMLQYFFCFILDCT